MVNTQEELEENDINEIKNFQNAFASIKQELSKIIVGQSDVVDQLLMAIFAKGHCILEGVPGLAKTLMISSLAKTLDLSFNRIQFTPDLMPTDITGTEIVQENKSTGERLFRFINGPIFSNLILADEINRTPPKTQSSLLEAMQEKQVTVSGQRHELPKPFFVLATQNPIEQEGTYPLPEAQQDRFMFKIFVGYPSFEEEYEIALSTTSNKEVSVSSVMSANDIEKYQQLIRKIPVPPSVIKYALRLVRATRIDETKHEFVKNVLSWGAGPRAVQNLLLGAKVRAAVNGRAFADIEDIQFVAKPVLRHRIVTNFNAEAEGLNTDSVIDRLIKEVSTSSHEDVDSNLKEAVS